MPLEARDSFPSAADFVRLVSEVIDDLPATGQDQPLYLDQLKIDLPFEIEVSAADPDAGPGAALTVAMSPPTQTFETGVMPCLTHVVSAATSMYELAFCGGAGVGV